MTHKLTEAEVELAERYAAALRVIKEVVTYTGDFTASDVELAERFPSALKAIEDAPEVDIDDVELAERHAAALEKIEDADGVLPAPGVSGTHG